MRYLIPLVCLGLIAGLVACSERPAEGEGALPRSTQTADAALPDEPTGAGPAPDQPEVPDGLTDFDKQAYLEMEDRYLRDPGAQWGVSARAGSTVGDEATFDPTLGGEGGADQATQRPDGRYWLNHHMAQGQDWLEVGFGRSAHAKEIRVVLNGRAAVGAITRVDVIDDADQPHTLWSGQSSTSVETRGPHTWFVLNFDKTPYKVNAVKVTFGNALVPGVKRVDAVQLVGVAGR